MTFLRGRNRGGRERREKGKERRYVDAEAVAEEEEMTGSPLNYLVTTKERCMHGELCIEVGFSNGTVSRKQDNREARIHGNS